MPKRAAARRAAATPPLLLAVAWLVTRATAASPSRTSRSPTPGTEARLQALELALAKQNLRLADLERVAPKEFEILHYNVLARQYGSNLQPWFLYGADLSAAEREELTRRFYEPVDADNPGHGAKGLPNKGWPRWAEGTLSPERMARAEAVERDVFAWEVRRERLLRVLEESHADVVTLSEADVWDEWWEPQLKELGYSVVWRKRPQQRSLDGCAICWRDSTFELEAQGGYDFGSSPRAAKKNQDRTCAFALLRWRRDPSSRLLVATTHLARDPNSSEETFSRGFQYGSLFRELLAFASLHDAEDVPVVLTGDLNAKDCDELAGIARALVRLLSTPTHPLLWSVLDVPTGPTSITSERSDRIDYVLYQSASLCLTGVTTLPHVAAPIPDGSQPSDHLPISAKLSLKPVWAQVEEDARQWLACVSGTASVRPLSGDALRAAFSYFDKDGSGEVSPVQLEAGLQALGYPGLDASHVRDALRRAGCSELGHVKPVLDHAGGVTWDGRDGWNMNLDQFVHVYAELLQRSDSSTKRQLEKAFHAFDLEGDGVIHRRELRRVLERMATAPIDEVRMGQLLAELDPNGTNSISLDDFSSWMGRTYRSYLVHPSLGPDRLPQPTPSEVYSPEE